MYKKKNSLHEKPKKYIIFYKPYGVLSQFTGGVQDKTLADYNLPKDIYAAGRLDKDSEGLLFLTNDGLVNKMITQPVFEKYKTYLVQVENTPTEEQIDILRSGVLIKNYKTLPAKSTLLAKAPNLPERVPPIRKRVNIPTSWLEIQICEGKNRQVRRMTASIGHPTLRLVRIKVGSLELGCLGPGEWREVHLDELEFLNNYGKKKNFSSKGTMK